ncbi:unnamed protein product [Trichogramma brassicae]|uniref:Uncharacterized protein n=1 Tax=Trichogramma brassicae TaxID=86971 RepID=A0A6H5IE16_9HYME|nr:unnamed protein product [Trichogramma brassicae]
MTDSRNSAGEHYKYVVRPQSSIKRHCRPRHYSLRSTASVSLRVPHESDRSRSDLYKKCSIVSKSAKSSQGPDRRPHAPRRRNVARRFLPSQHKPNITKIPEEVFTKTRSATGVPQVDGMWVDAFYPITQPENNEDSRRRFQRGQTCDDPVHQVDDMWFDAFPTFSTT